MLRGIRHVSDVQEKLMAMQETHDQKYHEIMVGNPRKIRKFVTCGNIKKSWRCMIEIYHKIMMVKCWKCEEPMVVSDRNIRKLKFESQKYQETMVLWQLISAEELRSQIQKAHRSLAEAVFFLKTCPAFKTQGYCFCKGSKSFKSGELMRKYSCSFLTWRWNKRKLSRWGRHVGKLVNGWWEEKDQMGTTWSARPRLGMPRWSGKSRIRTTSCHGTVLLGAEDFWFCKKFGDLEDPKSATAWGKDHVLWSGGRR